jgi:hypothetical protein
MVSPKPNPVAAVVKQMTVLLPFVRAVGVVRVPRFDAVQAPVAGTLVALTSWASASTYETPGGAPGIPAAELCGGFEANVPIRKAPTV